MVQVKERNKKRRMLLYWHLEFSRILQKERHQGEVRAAS